nr:type II toxin-antitoxin system RelE/ParE family toxin [Parabacteroides goldsteinii]
MKIEFGQTYLEELYEKRTCKNKKYRFQPEVINKYIKCINMMVSLKSIEDLYLFNSLHYEVLQGDKKGLSSVRVNSQYRIEFSVSQRDGVESVITVCTILELSNHYK